MPPSTASTRTRSSSAIAAVDRHLKLLAPPGLGDAAGGRGEHGIEGVAEGFADRAYRADGTLVPRSEPGAVLDEPTRSLAQRRRARGQRPLPLALLHSDTPGAAELAVAVRNRLIGAGFEVRPFS